MKKFKVIIADILSVVILAGCASGADINDAADETDSVVFSTSTEDTSINNDENTETMKMQESSVRASVKQEQDSPVSTETQKSEEYRTSEETSATVSEEIYESEIEVPETISETEYTDSLFNDEMTVYYDKYSGKNFIMLNVTPVKIYWNELDGFSITEGQPTDILIPAIFADWLDGADGIMIYLDSGSGTFGDILLDSGEKIKGMTYPQYWSTDYLCPIKDGIVCFGEYTDEIKNSFSRVDDGVYIEEANYQYSEALFEDNMSVEDLDLYFETIKKDHDALFKEIAENPDTAYEIAGFWGYQEGLRFRADINYIYS